MEPAARSYRPVAPVAALLLFLAMTALYAFGDRDIYEGIVRLWGVVPGPFGPFLDMHGLTAAWTCHGLGIGVIVQDPCDLMDRPFNYSPLWLGLSPFTFEGGAADALAWGCDLLFLLSLFLLPPPRRAREAILTILATLSTMVFYAIERANPDIIIFLIAMLAGFLALRSSWFRLIAYLLALFAGLLKYYPLTLLTLTCRERPARFVAVNLVALALMLVFVVVYFPDLQRGLPLVPTGSYYTDLFAAKNLPFGIADSLGSILGISTTSVRVHFLAWSLFAFLTLGCALICARILALADLSPSLAKLSPTESIFLAIGGILITGCFFAGQSIGYRGVFLLFVLPGLLALSRQGRDKGVRLLADFTSLVLLFLMWGECFRTNLIAGLDHFHVGSLRHGEILVDFWAIRELAWWWLVSVLLAIIVHFLLRSEMGACVTALLRQNRDRLANGMVDQATGPIPGDR